jgi:hypothetical protein
MASQLPSLDAVPKHLRWIVELTKGFVTTRNRRAASCRQKELIPALDGAIAQTRKSFERAKAIKLPHMMSIYNVALYLLILQRDVEIIKLEYVSTLENWKLASKTPSDILQFARRDMEACAN